MKLTKEVVEKISSIKGEPKWMLDFRLRSLDAFLKSNNPNFGPKLDIDYDNITYYKERENNLTDNWNNISCDVRNIFDNLGVISAEAKYLDGMGAQYDSEVIYHNMNEELKKKNVIFMDTDSALRKHPELFKKFSEVKDPRNQSYIDYSAKTMLGTLYYKCIGGISSMQEMTWQFNDEKVVGNLYSFMGESGKEYIPHGVMENEFLEMLDPLKLEKI